MTRGLGIFAEALADAAHARESPSHVFDWVGPRSATRSRRDSRRAADVADPLTTAARSFR